MKSPRDADPVQPVPSNKLLTVLLLTMGVGPLLTYGLSATSDLLIRRLDITESQFGLLATTLFICAALFSLVQGRLADVLSIRHQLIINFGGTAVALAIAAFATEYWFLFIAMAIGGPVQVIANPTTNRVIKTLVPRNKRASWIGVKQSGVQAAQLFGGLYFPIAALWMGWRGAFIGAAVIVLLLLLASLRELPPEDPTDWTRVRQTLSFRRNNHLDPDQVDRLPGAVWILAGVAFCGGLGMQATNVYLPLYAVRELDFSLVMGGVTAGVAGTVGVISRIYWGKLMTMGHTPAKLLLWLTTGGIVGVLLLMFAGDLQLTWMLWAGVLLYGLTVLGTNVIVNAGTMAIVNPERIGTASGITTLGMYAGFASGPFLSGLLLEQTGSFHASWIAVTTAYVVCLGLAVMLGIVQRNREAA